MKVYEINQNDWGVCGFVAAIQAAVSNTKKEVKLDSDSKRILYKEISEFVSSPYCTRQVKSEMLTFSSAFDRTKSEYQYHSVDQVLELMRNDINRGKTNSIGLAATATVMTAICKFMGLGENLNFIGTSKSAGSTNSLSIKNTDTETISAFRFSNCIYGIGWQLETKRSMEQQDKYKSLKLEKYYNNYRFGLIHWVYIDSQGTPMTYGEQGKKAVDFLRKMNFDKISHYIPI